MKEQYVIYSWSKNDRLELFLRKSDGTRVYLMAHRFNPTLYNYLKDGRSLREVRSFRPGRNRGEQSIEAALRQVLRVVDWLAAEEAAEALGLAG